MEPHGIVTLKEGRGDIFGIAVAGVKTPCSVYVPPRAIVPDSLGVFWDVEEAHYVDGRFLVRFANGLRAFWPHAPEAKVRVGLVWEALCFLGEEDA
jgi:hypothetical protein